MALLDSMKTVFGVKKEKPKKDPKAKKSSSKKKPPSEEVSRIIECRHFFCQVDERGS